jgi:hypothetical protein
MENIKNAQQKKAWVTPELIDESVEFTEGKFYNDGENPTSGDGIGPS